MNGAEADNTSLPKPPAQPVRARGTPLPRPRDAASLLLVRTDGSEPRILMGLRHARHRFLPEAYVFPGGAVESDDWRGGRRLRIHPDDKSRLMHSLSEARAHALFWAAIRETHEETGIDLLPLLGSGSGKGPIDARAMRYVARAITPPYRPIRFDARFFMLRAEAFPGNLGGDHELSDLRWVSMSETLTLPLARITRMILQQIGAAILSGREVAPVPCFRHRHGRQCLEFEQAVPLCSTGRENPPAL